MKAQKTTLLLAPLLSLFLLVPGIMHPLISLQANLERQAVVVEGKKLINEQALHPLMQSMANQFLNNLKIEGTTVVYKQTQSIAQTAMDLWGSGYGLVATLIVLFSIIIPAIKTLLLLTACAVSNNTLLIKTNLMLSKWSMADVFAIGVIIACLALNGSNAQQGLMTFHATLHEGFYYFVAYCITSIAAGQLIERSSPENHKQ